MRFYENILKTSENRLPQRAYYIPRGKAEYILLNGKWRFAYFSDEAEVPESIDNWDEIIDSFDWTKMVVLCYQHPV